MSEIVLHRLFIAAWDAFLVAVLGIGGAPWWAVLPLIIGFAVLDAAMRPRRGDEEEIES